ncbi:glutaredoxin-like protein NrdH [Sodalis ligni]|jgi:glutaredoxin-like protein NrdH|uniref:Glutaredoxin-like protein NrdH n=1 Tax=Sodalis ligni TaxID=2697027 RepID=A0A4R1NAG0_9GAMM|nr:glutaredoxin-like protein NrdH [Sodalis ligni]QWA12196.1 glutaredoxin-like protein NrdH [Sodalis ligni]TCL04394.1 ribonucleoside-diphosphate reductase class Ib glutaredoxin subunit [Sodalis ligni]
MSITIYTKPDCVQCHATCRALDSKGLLYRKVDILQDRQALDYVRSLGYQQVPVVETAGDSWSGFRPDKISGLAAAAMAS